MNALPEQPIKSPVTQAREPAPAVSATLYRELRRLAAGKMRHERMGHTLQPTALVGEAYLRLAGANQSMWGDRARVLGTAAHVMRQILIDHARSRNASKRGSGQAVFSLDEVMDSPLDGDSTVVRVDDALQALEKHDPLKGKLIEMRFFGGMTAEESATVLGLTLPKVRSELRIAQAWLKRELDNRAMPQK